MTFSHFYASSEQCLQHMKSSHIARRTAEAVERVSQVDVAPRNRPRSFASFVNGFAANGISTQDGSLEVKKEDLSDSGSSLSSVDSALSLDIEDAAVEVSTRKRKRGLETPSTTISTASATISTRTSPRKVTVKKAKREPAKQTVNDAGEVEIHPPGNWQEIYDAVVAMRKKVVAPVDTMGCESLAEEHLTARVYEFHASSHTSALSNKK